MPSFGEMFAQQLKGEANYTDEELESQMLKQLPSGTTLRIQKPLSGDTEIIESIDTKSEDKE